MRLIDAINNIDKSESNKDWVNLPKIAEELRLEYYDYEEQDVLTSYWIGNWYCTDTWVGYKVYFFNDEPVAFSSQMARKSDEEIKWFNMCCALKVRDYILSLIKEKNFDDYIDIQDINEEIGEGYKIHYNSNIIHKDKAVLDSKSVKIIERVRTKNDWGIDTDLIIELESGERVVKNIEQLTFKFNLKEK